MAWISCLKAWLNMTRLPKLNNQRYEYFIVNNNYDNIIFYNKLLLLFYLTECKPNFELSSFPFAISVPMHNDTGEFQHICKDTKMSSRQLTFN